MGAAADSVFVFPSLIIKRCTAKSFISLVSCRGPSQDRGDNDPALLEIKDIEDPVVPHSAPPCGRHFLEALEIPLKGIILHRNEDRFNALLISLRELLEVLLGRTGDDEVPRHGGMPLMRVHRRDDKRTGHDAARKVPPVSATPRDSGSRNMHATP